MDPRSYQTLMTLAPQGSDAAGLSVDVRSAWLSVDSLTNQATASLDILATLPMAPVCICRDKGPKCPDAESCNQARDAQWNPHGRHGRRSDGVCSCRVSDGCEAYQVRCRALDSLSAWDAAYARAHSAQATWDALTSDQRRAELQREPNQRTGRGLVAYGPGSARVIGKLDHTRDQMQGFADLLGSAAQVQATSILSPEQVGSPKSSERRQARLMCDRSTDETRTWAKSVLDSIGAHTARTDIRTTAPDPIPADLTHTCGPRADGETWSSYGMRTRTCAACRDGQVRLAPSVVGIAQGPIGIKSVISGKQVSRKGRYSQGGPDGAGPGRARIATTPTSARDQVSSTPEMPESLRQVALEGSPMLADAAWATWNRMGV